MTRFKDVSDEERARREKQYIDDHLKALVDYAAQHGWVLTATLAPRARYDERDRILRELDVRAFINTLPFSLQETILKQAWENTERDALAAMHAARYEMAHMEPDLRRQSRQWLEERKLPRFKNMPWPIAETVEG